MRAPFILREGIYVCPAFEAFSWQRHGFGTRQASPHVDVTLRQIHSDRVLDAHALADRECEGDALITNDPNRSIGIRTADCVPILLLDPTNHAIAAIHAGWRGTVSQIAHRTLDRMRADFRSQPSDIHAAIGPCIRACCYEVGAEVASHFDPDLLTPSSNPGKQYLDLAAANSHQLAAAGLEPAHIHDSGLCTACHPAHFFSYRREPANPDRLVSAIERLA